MENRYYQKEIETMPVEEIKKLQSEKLVKQVKHVYENVPYYKKLMDEKGVKPEDIKKWYSGATPIPNKTIKELVTRFIQ